MSVTILKIFHNQQSWALTIERVCQSQTPSLATLENAALAVAPLIILIFQAGEQRYCPKSQSWYIIARLGFQKDLTGGSLGAEQKQ